MINVDRNDKMYAYVDEVLVNSTDISDVKGSINSKSFVIGADGLKNYGIEDVYLDEIRVFNRILEEQERELIILFSKSIYAFARFRRIIGEGKSR